MAEMPQTQETQQQPPEDSEVQEPEVQEPEAQEPEEEEEEDAAQTNFVEIIEALTMGKGQLSQLKQANNGQVLRQFMLNDLYPILLEMANLCNWYIGNLHDRVSDLEEEQGPGEGISPEFAAELMEFIGISLQVFGELIPMIQTRPDMLHKVQLLVAQAPGLMARIQDATMTEEEEEEEEEEEKEVPEVVEPTSQKSASPQTPAAAEPTAEPEQPTEEAAPTPAEPEQPAAPTPAEPEQPAEAVESISVEDVVKTDEPAPEAAEAEAEAEEETNA
jgi:hypothetical protein